MNTASYATIPLQHFHLHNCGATFIIFGSHPTFGTIEHDTVNYRTVDSEFKVFVNGLIERNANRRVPLFHVTLILMVQFLRRKKH